MADLTPRQQLLYIGLFSNADDAGRLKASPASLKLILPTIYAGVPPQKIRSDLGAVLGSMRRLLAYTVDGRDYLAFENFRHWQKIDRPSASDLPQPPTESDDSANGHRTFDECSTSVRPSRARGEKKTEEEEEKLEEVSLGEDDGTREATAPAVAVVPPENLARFHQVLVGLPGFEPSPEFYAKLVEKYSALDLEEEALKMADWLHSGAGRGKLCSTRFVLKWLRTAAEETKAANYQASRPHARNGSVELVERGTTRRKHD